MFNAAETKLESGGVGVDLGIYFITQLDANGLYKAAGDGDGQGVAGFDDLLVGHIRKLILLRRREP